MPRILLYTQKINPYTEKVARALAIKKLPFERVESDNPDDAAYWSPVTKQLPVLEIDGERRHDSGAILRWLEERYPDPPLLSRDPATAAAQERMAEWSDASFVYYWNRWRAARFPLPGDEQPPDPGLRRSLSNAVRRAFGRAEGLSRAELREAEVIQELANRLDDLVGMLGDREFFHGAQPCVADLSIFGMLKVMRDSPMTGGGRALQGRPTLVAYMERMEAATKGV